MHIEPASNQMFDDVMVVSSFGEHIDTFPDRVIRLVDPPFNSCIE